MVKGPAWTADAEGDQVYSEKNLSDLSWETHNRHRPGASIVPLISGLDETHCSDFPGDKKACPIYLTTGNIQSPIRHKYSYLAQIVLHFALFQSHCIHCI